MMHLFNYPVTLTLQYDKHVLLDVTDALKISDKAIVAEVDIEKVLNIIHDHEVRGQPPQPKRYMLVELP